MSRLIVHNGVPLPMTGRRTICPGHLLIEGGRILALGEGAAPSWDGAERIDAGGGVVLPGLIDVHAHAGHEMTKGLGATSSEWMASPA